VNGAGRAVAAAGRNGEALPGITFNRHAKPLQQVERDFDVRAGDELALDLDHNVRFGGHQRQREQQSRQELARDVAPDPNRLVQLQCMGLSISQAKRGEARLIQTHHWATQLSQGIYQVTDRALVHAGHATQIELTAPRGGHERKNGCQGPHGRAGVAHEEVRLQFRPLPAQPEDPEVATGLAFDAASQLCQCGQHHLCVVRVQQVDDVGLAVAKRGEQ
jgi:hypothetical protein